MGNARVRIGGASGFWGDSVAGPLQLVASGQVDFLAFDYLAELTMALLAGARQKDPAAGYATDFVDVAMRATLKDLVARGIRVVSNAGGMNPRGCVAALRRLADELGVEVSIATVEGDDVLPFAESLREGGVRELGGDRTLPTRLLSANAYLGALPIKAALDAGAQIVVTGRCVDSATTLGALMHAFDWRPDDYDRLAMGSLAGHLIECGCQGAGGLFTDWDRVPDWPHAGYPIVDCASDGSFSITKPAGSGGLVTPATVAEQLVYEIGDPASYVLPDVVCDFRDVALAQEDDDRVAVRGARGGAPTDTYKVSATYADGFRSQAQLTLVGFDAALKAQRTAQAILARSRAAFERAGLPDFRDTRIEVLGAGEGASDAVLWLAASHVDRNALELFAREIAPAATSWAPGTTGFGGRPAATPMIRQFAFLLDKGRVAPRVSVDDREIACPLTRRSDVSRDHVAGLVATDVAPKGAAAATGSARPGRLIEIAHARSGDKGDSSNIGVIARRPEYVGVLREQLTAAAVKAHLAHLVEGDVTRFELPGIGAFNFVCERALGGGGMASLRNDPLGKGMAQLLLAMPVRIPT